MSAAKKRRAVDRIMEVLQASERRTCRVLEQPRSTQRHIRKVNVEGDRLMARITELACQYGRYGYIRITALLRAVGWRVNHKRVERIWREEGLKVPQKRRKRRRLWSADGSCVRLRPQYKDYVWSYDLVADRTSDGRPLKMLTMIDEYTRECLAIHVDRQITSDHVMEKLTQVFVQRGTPTYLRSDNGSEFSSREIRGWLSRLGVRTLFIEPGSRWENGYIEWFNGKLRDELLNREMFDTVLEAKVLAEQQRWEYNTIRPHSALHYRPPAPEAWEIHGVAIA